MMHLAQWSVSEHGPKGQDRVIIDSVQKHKGNPQTKMLTQHFKLSCLMQFSSL